MATYRTEEEERAFQEWKRARYPSERSADLAERAYAQSRGEVATPGQTALATARTQMGAPTEYGGLQRFTDEQGFTQTFSGEGRKMSEGSPVHYSNRYSPYDQKKLEGLYQARSQAATDPEASESDRERNVDLIDSQISQVPQLPPGRREPTAQEKFDASIVTAPDGTKGTVDKNGGFTAFDAETKKEYRLSYTKNLENQRKLKEELLASKDDEAVARGKMMDFGFMRNQAKQQTDDEFGMLGKPDIAGVAQTFDHTIAAALDRPWKHALATASRFFGRASVAQMLEVVLPEYIEGARLRGIDEGVATLDFLSRWKEEAGLAGFMRDDAVAPWNDKLQSFLDQGKLLESSKEVPQGRQSQADQTPYAAVNGQQQAIPQGPYAEVGGVEVPATVAPGQQRKVLLKDDDGKTFLVNADKVKAMIQKGFKRVM